MQNEEIEATNPRSDIAHLVRRGREPVMTLAANVFSLNIVEVPPGRKQTW